MEQPQQPHSKETQPQTVKTAFLPPKEDIYDSQSYNPLGQGVSPSGRVVPLAKQKKIRKQRGRPSKQEVDRKHSKISKQFNNIIYHYARFLIFLRLLKKEDGPNYTPSLTPQQASYMQQALAIMDMDVFPSIEQRNKVFLLHANSLHFILDYNKNNKQITLYAADRIKYYLFAFLQKRNLLTKSIYTYVSNYWYDIIYLINSPSNNKSKGNPHSRQLYRDEQSQEEQSRGEMQRELGEDSTIAAYEIACYLKSCCEAMGVVIKRYNDCQNI